MFTFLMHCLALTQDQEHFCFPALVRGTLVDQGSGPEFLLEK